MPFFSLPASGQITPEWFKALRLQLDRDDDEKEQKVRMAVERRFEREMRAALDDMLDTLFPEGYGEFVNPQIEANRIHEAFLRDQKMRDTVSRAIQDSADLGVSVAVQQLESVGYGFDYTLANVNAREWALAHTDTLLNQLGTTSGKVVGQAVGRWAGNGEPLQKLINDLAPAFGQARAERIAATEVTRAYAEGSTRTYQESGVVQKVEWATARDERVCIVCGPLEGKTVPVGSKFDGLYPPAHVGCRCWVLPVVKEPKRGRNRE
jgi:SPP1 gp7 family putative phage head morphogenesis protein